MNNLKFAALSRYLDSYPDEYNQYIEIVNSYYFPFLLKIAQQQLPLFENTEIEEAPVQPKYDENFSFKSLTEDSDDGAVLDLILNKLKNAYPDKTNDELIDQLKNDFIDSRPEYTTFNNSNFSIFGRRPSNTNKYFDLFPDLQWKPEFQQLKIPFEEKTLQTRPLGQSAAESISSEDETRYDFELLSSDEEAKNIFNSLINIKNLGDIPQSSMGRLQYILDRKIQREGTDEYSPKDISVKLEKVLKYYLNINTDKIYFKKEIDEIKNEIETKWKELYSLFSQVNLLKLEITPDSFTPKPATEINNFKESIIAAGQYSKYIIKKISSENIDVTPFKEFRYSIKNGRISSNLDDIKNYLENMIFDKIPRIDGNKKIAILDNQISIYKFSIENIKKYKNLFKKLDKDLENECMKYLSSIDSEHLKVINWMNKYRRDLIRESYLSLIKTLASRSASEAKNYDYDAWDAYDDSYNFGKIEKILYSNSNLSSNRSNSTFSNRIIGILSHQQYDLFNYAKIYISKKILFKLFQKCEILFRENFFEYPLEISDRGGDVDILLSKKNIPITIDQIKKFIQDWNGKPNIKSFLNVIFSNTKNISLVDKYLQTRFNKSDAFDNMIYLNINDFSSNVINFISKSKSKTEEELISLATDALTEEFFNFMKKNIADNIYYKLESINKFELINYDRSLNLDSESLAPLGPTVAESSFGKWLSLGGDDFSWLDGKSINITLTKILKSLKNHYRDIVNLNPEIEQLEDGKNKEVYNKLYEIIYKTGDINYLSKKDKYKLIDNVLNIISPVLSEFKGQLKTPYYGNNKYGLIPIMEGCTVTISEDAYAGRSFKVKTLKYSGDVVLDIDGIETEFGVSYNNYGPLKIVYPTIDDFYEAISSLKQKDNINNYNITNTNINYIEIINNIKLILNELKLPTINLHVSQLDFGLFKQIFNYYNNLKYFPDNLVDTIRTIVEEIKTMDQIYLFNKETQIVASTFGGVGFKDISSGIDDVFSRNKLDGISRKEFITKISSLVSDSFKPELYDATSTQNMFIHAFLNTIKKTNYQNNFDDIITPIIKKLNLKDLNSITQVCYQVTNSGSRNFSHEDIKKALIAIKLDGVPTASAIEKIIASASFLHNHASLPTKYIKTVINSPNFYSDSKISQEYVDSCTILFKYGGISEINNVNSKLYEIIEKMVVSNMITNIDQFKLELNAFSKLCMKKDGIRSNLGNSTANVKLDYLLKKIVDKFDDGSTINFDNYIPAWSSLSFEDKVVKLKEYAQSLDASDRERANIDSKTLRIYAYVRNGEFDKEVENIRQTASTEQQYFKDLKIKQIIQKATSNFKMLEMCDNLFTYAKNAKKKDERLFNFEYTSPDNLFRFRVLRDLDPYHFLVGADTNCCQRIGGVGHNAAADSFINPLAGVLLMEVKYESSWVMGSQSYFHYVPSNNGLILDNVEYNSGNCYNFFNSKKYDIETLYAAFSEYVKNKYNLSYVRCGERYNKLDNNKFIGGRLEKGDPRHFEYKKYSDFKASDHIDLLKPKFKFNMKLK